MSSASIRPYTPPPVAAIQNSGVQTAGKRISLVARIAPYAPLQKELRNIDWSMRKGMISVHSAPTFHLIEPDGKKTLVHIAIPEPIKIGPNEDIQIELGSGGSKKAYLLEEKPENALLLPNLERSLSKAQLWALTVNNEIEISRLHTQYGLLSLQPRKVYISVEEGKELPAYLSILFESMKKRGIYVVDTKNSECSTWEKGLSLFEKNVNVFDPKNWEPILTPLLQDITKIARHNIPFDRDSLNLAIQETKAKHKFEARYLGFDFPMSSSKIRETDREKDIECIFSRFITDLCILEAGTQCEEGIAPGLPENYKTLQKTLEKTYRPIVLEMVENQSP